MKDEDKTKDQLINELVEMRQRVAELETSETERKRAEEALRESEERYRRIFEQFPIGIGISSIDGKAVAANKAMEAITGYSVEELKKINLADTYENVEDREALLEAISQYGGVVDFPVRLNRKDGTPYDALLSISQINLGGKDFLHTICQDITERKRAEEEIRQRTAQLEALRQVGLEITAELDLDALLRYIVSRAVELLGGTAGGLYLHRPEEDVLAWVMTVGPSPVPPGSILHRGEGLSGKVWETGEPLIVDDYRHWEGLAIAYEGFSIVAVVGVPVQWGGEFLGVLIVEADAPRTFSPADAELLSLFATQAAIAIRNARLYEEARSRAERLAVVNHIARAVGATLRLDDLLETVYREVTFVFQADAFFIALYDEETNELNFRLRVDEGVREPQERRPLGPGLTALVVSEKKPILIRDFEKEKDHLPEVRLWGTMKAPPSWLGVPMLISDQVVGVICVQAYRPYAYGEEEQLLLSTIADQVAVAIEKARLFQGEREQRQLAEALEEAAAVVNSTLEPDQVLDHILEQVERVVAGEAFNIMLIEDDIARVVRWRGYEHLGIEEQIARLTIPVAEFPSLVKMAQTGEPVVMPDTFADPGWALWEGWEWLRSYVGAPIRVGGVTVGVLNVDGTRPGQFGPADAPRLKAFADHAAAAIENARLFKQAQQEIAERKRAEETIKRLAYHDTLTGLPNRRLLNDRLNLALAHAHRSQQKLAVMLLDLDYFKDVNDTLGHSVGDKLLQVVGDRLTSLLRKSDTVARMGGDEFMLMSPEIAGGEDAAKIAQKTLEAFREPFVFDDHELHITTSIGIALYPDAGEDADTLMKNADIAMYRAKDQGRDNYQRYTPDMNAKALD